MLWFRDKYKNSTGTMVSKLDSLIFPEKLLTERLYRVVQSRSFFSLFFYLEALSATKQNRAHVIQIEENEQGPRLCTNSHSRRLSFPKCNDSYNIQNSGITIMNMKNKIQNLEEEVDAKKGEAQALESFFSGNVI